MKVLLFRKDNIGDLVLTTPTIEELRCHASITSIHCFVNSYSGTLLKYCPGVDRIFFYTKVKHLEGIRVRSLTYWRLLKVLIQLRVERYDVIVFVGNARLFENRFVLRWIGAKRVLAYGELKGLGFPRPAIQRLNNSHAVYETFELVRPLLGLLGEPPPVLLSRPLKSSPERLIAGCNQRSRVHLHISARRKLQKLSIEYLERLLKELLTSKNIEVAVTWAPGDFAEKGHPGDDALAQNLMKAMKGYENVFFLRSRTLEDLIEVLGACDASVCPDGGTMHIAAALGLPTLGLFGDVDPEKWRPWSPRSMFLKSVTNNVNDIPIKDVSTSVNLLLS